MWILHKFNLFDLTRSEYNFSIHYQLDLMWDNCDRFDSLNFNKVAGCRIGLGWVGLDWVGWGGG